MVVFTVVTCVLIVYTMVGLHANQVLRCKGKLFSFIRERKNLTHCSRRRDIEDTNKQWWVKNCTNTYLTEISWRWCTPVDVDLTVKELMGVQLTHKWLYAQCSLELLFIIIALVPFLIVASCNKVLFTRESCSFLILFSTEISHYLCFSASLTEAYLVGVDHNIFFSLRCSWWA